MKRLQFITLMAFLFLITACGKDKGDCLRDDFVGTFVGFSLCGTQRPVDAIVNITAGAAADELLLDIDGAMVTVKVDGCSFSGEEKAQSVDLKYSGTLDANKIDVKLEGTIGNIELDCRTEAIR